MLKVIQKWKVESLLDYIRYRYTYIRLALKTL